MSISDNKKRQKVTVHPQKICSWFSKMFMKIFFLVFFSQLLKRGQHTDWILVLSVLYCFFLFMNLMYLSDICICVKGCILDVQFRTRRDRRFQALGQPAGRPAFGRSVGQCGVTPCVQIHCRNGGTCVDSGSSV